MKKYWTREETILAFNLYCKIPFSMINANHTEIIKLSKIINCTPNSVAMKLLNMASLDVEIAINSYLVSVSL